MNDYFCRWRHDGTLERLHHALYVFCREQADRKASLSVAIIDSQSVKSAVVLMATLFGLYPVLLKLYADAAIRDRSSSRSLAQVCRAVNIEIVRRCDSGGFVVLPKRWNVECTIAWLDGCRRLARDWECLNRNALAFLRVGSFGLG